MAKKLLLGIILASFLMGLIAVPYASATSTTIKLEGPAETHTFKHNITINVNGTDASFSKASSCDFGGSTTGCETAALVDSIYSVIDIVFAVVIVAVILTILWAAFLFITSAGSEEKIASARKYIVYALIGLVVALLVKAIPFIVVSLIK